MLSGEGRDENGKKTTIAAFHVASLKFKLQNYLSYRNFTFTMY